MLIKSTRVWVCGRFLSAIIEVEDKKIIRILPYSDQKVDYDLASELMDEEPIDALEENFME